MTKGFWKRHQNNCKSLQLAGSWVHAVNISMDAALDADSTPADYQQLYWYSAILLSKRSSMTAQNDSRTLLQYALPCLLQFLGTSATAIT
jgi:hypothetical protein